MQGECSVLITQKWTPHSLLGSLINNYWGPGCSFQMDAPGASYRETLWEELRPLSTGFGEHHEDAKKGIVCLLY